MLRIIAGRFRSRRIHEVKSHATRPTTDKNREALFNSLGQFFDGGQGLDLFAGSGALGLEAISRGLDHLVFVDKQSQAIKTIEQNVNQLGLSGETTIVFSDVLAFLEKTDLSFDLILADPPYAVDVYNAMLKIISCRHLLKNDGIIVVEAERSRTLPEQIEQLEKYRVKTMGITQFAFYTWKDESS